MSQPTPLLEVESVSKAFPGVQALSDVSIDIVAGEVHAIVGENGAGKSTLMKILAGVYQPDQGILRISGSQVSFQRPADAQDHGISIIYQEFNLLPDLTVAENILLKREPLTRWGLVDWKRLNEQAAALMAEVETVLDPRLLVEKLTIAQQQIVEIVKSVAADAQLIIMDEPTAALNPTEVEHLFHLIERLTASDKAVIFISHRLDEVLKISDRITVMKDGEKVGTWPAASLTNAEIVRYMVGRSLQDIFPAKASPQGENPLLKVQHFNNRDLHDISFDLMRGEVLGLAGLEGQGQREMARALFGLEPRTSGEYFIDGERLLIGHPRHAIEAGIVFISDDRKGEGLALELGVRENVSLPNLGLLSRFGLTQPENERRLVQDLISQFDVKTPTIEQPVRYLSGGNQQKAVLSKWMAEKPKVAVFVEPTRGIDVGAKVEIYQLIHDLAQQGTGVVVVSSDLIELLGLSSRILVMNQGRLVAELSAEQATEESVMHAATGGIHV